MKTTPATLPSPEIIDIGAIIKSYLDGDIDLICVLGPTASGKTRYAVSLAKSAGVPCEIISADSRQVYRGMDIGTGKDLAEYDGVPYHIIDVADPGEQYNVYRFREDFRKAYADIVGRGAVPILCGGTGLYINAVTSGYDFQSSKPLSEAGQAGAEAIEGLPRHTYFIGTLVSREVRNARIDARLDARLQEGMVDEIRGLIGKGVDPQALIAYGLEYKFITQFVLGELSFEEMREKLAIAIHQFAKRQMTWFRGMERSGCRIHWVLPG